MTADRHLILQEKELPPSAEWQPPTSGWLGLRIAAGQGYWLQSGAAVHSLTVGNVLFLGSNVNGMVRASQLGPLQLHYLTVQPELLIGVLTIAEGRQLQAAAQKPDGQVRFYAPPAAVAERFARLVAEPPGDELSRRCAGLQVWSLAMSGDLAALPPVEAGDDKLHERFRQLVGQIPESELAVHSLADLAGRLHCSERHFSRLFREEYGASLRAWQIELRLQRARHLLTHSDAKIINVALDSGYHHLGLFNARFKKRFGMTPGEWRRQNVEKSLVPRPRGGLKRLVPQMAALLAAQSLPPMVNQLERNF
jgi:AraC-like DNA-binding protein